MGAYTLLQDLTVASNSTSVVLNNFGTITKDDFVKVVATFNVNSSFTFNEISLHANASTSNSSYHRQRLGASGLTVGASRINNAEVIVIGSSLQATSIGYLKLSENDRFNAFFNTLQEDSSAVANIFRYMTSSGATFSSGITTLTFTGNQTNGIGTGSRIQIYKLDAEKVADITVTSNTTQVDISNLSIDKDSEYLLVSDVLNVSGLTLTCGLTPNDATTLTDYHFQRINGVASTAAASRQNAHDFIVSSASNDAVAYSHIKLSNIGAYTSQSYAIRNYGTSSLELVNHFVSSTSEAITSITKLNIIGNKSNGIGTGSRFILYKLYE